MQTVRISTSQNIDIDYQVASLNDRITARAIDYVIFLLVYTMFSVIFVTSEVARGANGNPFITGGFLTLIIIWLAFCVLYDLLTEVFFNGQSFGKRSVKIRVISLNGSRPGLAQYLLRWVFRIIDFGITFGTAAVISVAFSDNKQRIGDIVAGTTVIKTTPLNKFTDLVFGPSSEDHNPTYNEVLQLTDQDIVLIYDVIKNFNRTRNSLLVYKLALRIKAFLNVSYPREINEYEFLEIILNDYNSLISNNEL